MGKKHRRTRSTIKTSLSKKGWYENEFGELKKRMTKGEARRELYAKLVFLRCAQNEIIQLAVERARKAILEEEDLRVFEDITKALETDAY